MKKLEYIMEHEQTHKIFAVLIIINAIIFGLETSKSLMEHHGRLIHFLDYSIYSIFIIEILLRLIGCGRKFFKSGWNTLDFLIIGTSLITSSSAIVALRALRVLRIAEIFSMSKQMRVILGALFSVVPGIMHIAGMLVLMFYIASIMAYDLFSTASAELFGSLSKSMYTLFLVMLGDNVGDKINVLMPTHPYAYLFFVIFIALMAFTMLNLLFGLIVDAVQSAAENEKNDNSDDIWKKGVDKKLTEISKMLQSKKS